MKTTSTSICYRTSERRHRIRCSVDIRAADRERVLFVEQANHLLFRDHEDSRHRDRGRRFKPNGMTRERVLTEEVARSEHPDNGLSTRLRQHGELHGAFLN
jgi:hypothetical protein